MRICADGHKQRKTYDNVDATSPTVSTEELIISAVIDAFKEQDVAVVDITGAYLSTEMDNDVFIIFRGTMYELMAATDPTMYQNYISYGKKGKALLYMRL